jgi:hypothetical protein
MQNLKHEVVQALARFALHPHAAGVLHGARLSRPSDRLEQGPADPTGYHDEVEQLVSARYFRYSYQRANGWIVLTGVFNYFDADVKGDTLVVFFDGDDIVEDYAFAEDTRLLPRFGPFSRATEEDSAEARIDTSAGRAERAAEQAAAAAERTSEAAARAEHAADRVESIRASD